MHRQSLNHHLDLDCPVLHGYGDHARASDASSTARSSIQSGPRESDAVALRRPSDASSDASRYAACPVCSESVLLSDMNYHLELRCRGAAAEAPAAPAAEELVAADAIGACPLCDQKMPLVAIADHIDAGCPKISAKAPSPPRESRVLEDLRQGASCPLCMDVLDDPHCLPCAHSFCKDCILRAFQTTRPGHGHECPVCRAPCRKRSIQPAAQLRALVDIVRRAEAAAAPAEDAAEEPEDEDEAEEEPVEAPPSPAPVAAPSPPPSPVRSPEEEATLARVRGNLARALAAEPPAAASPVAPASPVAAASPSPPVESSPPAESLLARRRAAQSAPDEESAEPSPSPSPEPLARRRPRRAAAQSSDAALARRLQDSAVEAATRKKKRRK